MAASVEAERGPRRLLVVVAHPDDETFGTGSVIAWAVDSGAEVVVCCATRGEAGEAHRLAEGVNLGSAREAELRSAGAVLGVTDFVLLGYADPGMTGELPPDSLAGASMEEVAARVARVVDEFQPDVVVTLDPVNGDGHRDHDAIGRATIAACSARNDITVYVWAVSRSTMARWFAEMERSRFDSEHLDLDRAGIGRPESDITTVLDVSKFRDHRVRAMAEHRSQQPPFDGMPAELAEEFLATDHLVRVQPPWPGGPLERALRPVERDAARRQP